MSLSRAEVREQMIDYLYGELQGEALAAFEAALRESEQSRRELAELQATLRAARGELARDAHAQPPARVRDAVLKAAEQASQAARVSEAPAAVAQGALLGRALGWLRSIWILPTLVAASAAALLVFRQEQHMLSPEAPAASSSPEAVHTEPPSSAAEPEGTNDVNLDGLRTSESSSSGDAPDRAVPPPAPVRKPRPAHGESTAPFAKPPVDWQRSRADDRAASAPRSTPAASAPTHDERAAGGGLGAAERRGPAVPEAPEASDQRATRSLEPLGTAAPAAAAPSSRPAARPSTDAPAPLTAASLERRAQEHAAATRWAQAADDYRELLRRFAQHPRRKLWTEQLELALRAAAPRQ